MGRPRKDRVAEYAGQFAEEFKTQIIREVARVIEEKERLYHEEMQDLKKEVRVLSRQLEELARKGKAPKTPLGKWVPGGPGRPPKDADRRIAAFETRRSAEPEKPKPKRGKKRKSRSD